MKRIQTNVYRQDAGSEDKILLAKSSYDEHGNILSETRFGEDGETVAMAIARSFDENSNLLAETVTVEGEERKNSSFAYDSKNRRVEEKYFDTGLFVSHLEYEWNEDGLRAEIYYLDEDGDPVNKEVRIFDKHGNSLSEIFYDENDQEVEGIVLAYDEQQNIISKISKMGGFDLHSKVKNTYDKEGRLLEARLSDEDGEEELDNFEYYPDGTRKEHVRVEMTGAKMVSFFDEKGRLVKQNRHDTTDYIINELSSFYGDEHDYVTKRTVREDRKYYQLIFEYSFSEVEVE